MGNTVTVIATIITVVQVALAGNCIGPPSDYKNAECDSLTKDGPVACRQHVTPNGNCRWEEGEQQAAPKVAIGKSLNIVGYDAASGRLTKDLVPIEAVAEWIGDVLYYIYLQKLMPKQFTNVLSNIKNPYMDFTIQPSKYPKIDKIMTLAMRGTVHPGGPLTDKELAAAQNPIQTLLQYSRPYFPTKPYRQKIVTIDTFTISNVIQIAVIAWIDALFFNNDRFILHPKSTWANHGNMMLYEYKLKGSKLKRYTYFPIDQGFARLVYVGWFKHITKKYSYSHIKKWPNEQIVWTESGLKTVPTEHSKQWLTWYKDFLLNGMGDKVKQLKKAEEFVTKNKKYFPVEIKNNKIFHKKISEIIYAVWNGIGTGIITDCAKLANDAIRKINTPKSKKTLIAPDVKPFLKNKKDKYAWQMIKKEWKGVQSAIDTMLMIGSKFKEAHDARQLYVEYIAKNEDILAKDYHPEAKPLPKLNKVVEDKRRGTIAEIIKDMDTKKHRKISEFGDADVDFVPLEPMAIEDVVGTIDFPSDFGFTRRMGVYGTPDKRMSITKHSETNSNSNSKKKTSLSKAHINYYDDYLKNYEVNIEEWDSINDEKQHIYNQHIDNQLMEDEFVSRNQQFLSVEILSIIIGLILIGCICCIWIVMLCVGVFVIHRDVVDSIKLKREMMRLSDDETSIDNVV